MKEKLASALLNILPRRVMNNIAGEFVPIFMLHSMVNHNNEPDYKALQNLRSALEYTIKKKYNPISLDGLFRKLSHFEPLANDSVSFTVDDGYIDQFELIAPIFSEFDIPLTCFVVTDFIDGKLWLWDAQVDYIIMKTKKKAFKTILPNGQRYDCCINTSNRKASRRKLISHLKKNDQTHIYDWLLNLYKAAEVDEPTIIPKAYRAGSWKQIKQFQKDGHSVAAHGTTHSILSQLTAKESKLEITEAYRKLQEKIPDCSRVFAYSSGRNDDFSSREEKFVQESEMIGAVSAMPGFASNKSNHLAVPRFGLPNNMFDFMQYISYIEVLKFKVRNKTAYKL